jgi:hypothetical protein
MKWQNYILRTVKLLALTIATSCLACGATMAKDGDDHGGGRGNRGGGDGGGPSPAMHTNGGDAGPQHESRSSGQNIQEHAAPPQGQDGTQHQSFFRGPDGNDNANNTDRSRVEDFLNGKGSDHGSNDFRNRFTDRDNSDRNGDNFRRNADVIRRDFHDRNRNDLPFQFGWWDNRRFDRWGGPWAFNSWRDRPWYWWGWSTAAGLDTLFGWNQPYYWDYGPNGYVYYQNDQFYRNGQPYMAANEYYQQVYNLAHSAPSISQDEAAQTEWISLGVFAVTSEGKQEKDRMIQLAINKQGTLSGTYYNRSNNGAHPIQGTVDQRTHRAAWYLADGANDQMVFETSVDNLTEPQSTVMVHFAPGNVGVWQMVRLERPESSAAGSSGQALPEAAPQQGLP